jgi:hypothetical protein
MGFVRQRMEHNQPLRPHRLRLRRRKELNGTNSRRTTVGRHPEAPRFHQRGEGSRAHLNRNP